MNTSIKPGQVWLDTDGKRIEAHGGYLFYDQNTDTFYWYGENKEYTDGMNKIWTWGIRYYSSKDLYNWTSEGFLIEAEPENPNAVMFPEHKVDRPHIIYNKSTKKYVCWLKLSGESACFAIYTANQFQGPYTLIKRDYQPFGKKVGDFDFGKDEETGEQYLFFDADHEGIVQVKLREDYCGVCEDYITHRGNLYPPFVREAPVSFWRDGKYYLLSSGMTGYLPNPSESAVADSIHGPYKVQGELHAEDETCSSFSSQISCVFRHPKKKDLYIALADRWVPEYEMSREKYESIVRVIAGKFEPDKYHATQEDVQNLMKSPMLSTADTSKATYVWLPLRFEGERVWIDWKEEWHIEDYK